MPKVTFDIPDPDAYLRLHKEHRAPRTSKLPVPQQVRDTPAPTPLELEDQQRMIVQHIARMLGQTALKSDSNPAAPKNKTFDDDVGGVSRGPAHGKDISDDGFSADINPRKHVPAPENAPTQAPRPEVIRALLEKPAKCICFACGKSFTRSTGRRKHWNRLPGCKTAHDAEVLEALRSDEYHAAIQESEKFVYWAPPPSM